MWRHTFFGIHTRASIRSGTRRRYYIEYAAKRTTDLEISHFFKRTLPFTLFVSASDWPIDLTTEFPVFWDYIAEKLILLFALREKFADVYLDLSHDGDLSLSTEVNPRQN